MSWPPGANEPVESVVDLGSVARIARETITAPHERAKVTHHHDHHTFTVYGVTAIDETSDPLDPTIQRSRIIGIQYARAILTIRLDHTFGMDEVRDRCRMLDEPVVGMVVHTLLDTAVDGYFDSLEALDERLELLEDDLFGGTGTAFVDDFQVRAYQARKEIVALRRLVLPMRDVANSMWRIQPDRSAELEANFNDLNEHVLRVSEWTESLRDMVSTLLETHLSLQDQRLNTTMRKLAGWAAVISIPTMVTGFFGMNVPYWGFGRPAGVGVAMFFFVVPALTVYLVMRRLKWL